MELIKKIFSKKRLFIVFMVLVFTYFFYLSTTTAAPALWEPFTLHQPDRFTFQAVKWGDEFRNGTETTDGYSIVHNNSSGYWHYGKIDSSGFLISSDRIVGQHTPPVDIGKYLRNFKVPNILSYSIWSDVGVNRDRIDFQNNQFKVSNSSPNPHPPQVGTHHLLALIVNFTPSVGFTTTEIDWQNHFFTGGTTHTPMSVKNYWDTISYGQITLQPASESFGTANNGIVMVTLNYPHPNTGGVFDDRNRQIVRDALIAADPLVNYQSFDANGDGYLNNNELHLFVVVRGYEMSATNSSLSPGVWGHNWSLGHGAITSPQLDGVYVAHYKGAPSGNFWSSYSQVGEWMGSGNHIITIGISVHELGHDMGSGLPDLYDTDGSSFGIGRWSVMAQGSWNGGSVSGFSGTHPAWLDPWNRWFLGFITPTWIIQPIFVNFPQIQTALGTNRGVFQLLDNPNGVDWNRWGSSGTGEYFLIENRQQVGFDLGLPGNGLLIWHICETVVGNNTANAKEGVVPHGSPRLVVLEQADGRFDLEKYYGIGNTGDSEDPYKLGVSTTFDNFSNPNSKLYGSEVSGAFVRNISASGASMTANIGVNFYPFFTNLPQTQVFLAGLDFIFNATAIDPDADTLTYSLVSGAPAGMTINPSTGVINWSPTVTGKYFIIVGVTDGVNPQVASTLTLHVNSPPFFTNLPISQLTTPGTTYTYTVVATDPDADTLTYSLVSGAPAGMNINDSSGEINWTPNTTQVGTHTVVVGASDNINPIVSATLTITVLPPLPTIDVAVLPITIERGKSATLTWSSTNATSITVSPSIDISPMPLLGSATVSPTTTTTYVFTATGPGGTVTTSVTLTVTEPPPPPPTHRTVELRIGSTIYKVDGVVSTMDAAPYIEEGRTMVPVRFLAEGLGGTVDWDNATKTVIVRFTKPVLEIKLIIGNPSATVNGNKVQIDTSNIKVVPVIKNNRTFVPLRFLVEQITGSSIDWVPPDIVIMKLPR